MAWTIEELEEHLLIGSTLVEGSTLTEGEAQAVLAGRTVVGHSVREIRELTNYRPMTRLSDLVTEQLAGALRSAIERGEFPGISMQQAMEFLLSDGIVPASDLPVRSIPSLEDWARCRGAAPATNTGE